MTRLQCSPSKDYLVTSPSSTMMPTVRMFNVIIFLCLPLIMATPEPLGTPRYIRDPLGPLHPPPTRIQRIWTTRRSLVSLAEITTLLSQALPLLNDSLLNMKKQIDLLEQTSTSNPLSENSYINLETPHSQTLNQSNALTAKKELLNSQSIYSRLQDARNLIRSIQSLFIDSPEIEGSSIYDSFDAVPHPTLFNFLLALRVTAEPIVQWDLARDDTKAFQTLYDITTQTLSLYRIVDGFMHLPPVKELGTETTLFRPEFATFATHQYIGTLKYYNHSTYAEYEFCPQTYVTDDGNLMLISSRYLYVEQNSVMYASTGKPNYFLCDTNSTGTRTCDVQRPVDVSIICGRALLTGIHMDDCPAEAVSAPMYYTSIACDNHNTSVHLFTPFSIDMYYSCNISQPRFLGHFRIGSHTGVDFRKPIGEECTFKWTQYSNSHSLHVMSMLKDGLSKQYVNAMPRSLVKGSNADDQVTWITWHTLLIILFSACATSCCCFTIKTCYDWLRCIPCKRKIRVKRNILHRYIIQQRDEPTRRSRLATVLYDDSSPPITKRSINMKPNNVRLPPLVSPMLHGNSYALPGPYIVPVDPYTPSAPPAIHVMDREAMAGRRLDHGSTKQAYRGQ